MSDVEQELREDLTALEDRFGDNQFGRDLYRALANTTWRKGGSHVALSWGKAEELVNELRARVAQDPLELAQSGGEGEITQELRDALETLGWSVQPLNTSREDPQHVSREEGEARTEPSQPEVEQAHAEAETGDRSVPTGQGPGGGGTAGSAGGGSQSA